MFSQYFGNYLLKNNRITPDQLQKVREYQNKNRAKLGLIAVNEGLLTIKQADELNRLQVQQDKRFGDLAVEKGYLTDDDITNLLRLQGNPYLTFMQALEDLDVMSQADAEVIVASFQKEKHLSNSDLTAIKSGDIDNLVSLFVSDAKPLEQSFVSLALRNIVRFVTPHFRFEKARLVHKYSAHYLALQRTKGDMEGMLGFASDVDPLLHIAAGFAGEHFSPEPEDAFDAVCEFINCINGLFATQIYRDNIDIDMLPPESFTDKGLTAADGILVVPVFVGEDRFDLLVGVQSSVQVV